MLDDFFTIQMIPPIKDLNELLKYLNFNTDFLSRPVDLRLNLVRNGPAGF